MAEKFLVKTAPKISTRKKAYAIVVYNKKYMFLWDYDRKILEKTKKGRLLILERMINYGPGDEKIKLSEVKKNWDKLHLFKLQKRLFELLIWGKYSSLKSKKSFWIW